MTRGGCTLRLGKLTFQLLQALAEAAPRVVTKDELVEHVWGKRYVSPETVGQRIKLLREALGDDAHAPRYIEVVRGQGYRLIPPVELLPAEELQAVPPVPRMRRRVLLAGAAVLLLAAALIVGYQPADRRPSIAVLPFVTLSADPGDDLFAAGIHSELLTTLTKISGLKTIYLTSVLHYRADADSPQEVGRALGVDTVLVGDFRRVDDAFRINVRLIDTHSGEQLWAWASPDDEPLAHETGLTLQAQTATEIASRLEVALSPEETTRVIAVPTRDREAWSLYLAVKAYEAKLSGFSFGKGSDEGERRINRLRIDQYQKATQKDSNFALAWAGLADAYCDFADDSDDPDDMRRLAKRAAQKALDLQPDLPEAHIGMGRVLSAERQYAKALEQYAIAEQGMPGNAEVYRQRALTLRHKGSHEDYERAVVEFGKAIHLDPKDHFARHQLALAYARLRDYARAERTFDALLYLYPDHGISYDWKVDIPKYRGDLEGMKVAIDETVARTAEVFPGNQAFWRNRAKLWRWAVAFRERDFAAALDHLHAWEARGEDQEEQAAEEERKARFLGLTFWQMGDDDRARGEFERVVRIEDERARGDDLWALARRAEASAYLGDSDRAMSLAHETLELLPERTTGFDRHWIHIEIIWSLIAAQQYDWALDELEKYLAAPGAWTIEGLLLDPRLDALRANPDLEYRLTELEHKFGRRCWTCRLTRLLEG